MANKLISPRFSFKGWRFGTWLQGNGKTIKELLKLGIPVVVAYMSTKSPYWTTFGAIIGKLVLDSAEYFIKEKYNQNMKGGIKNEQ